MRADDFVVVTDEAARVYVLPSSGDGTFGSLALVGDFGSRARGAAIADFDNDGVLDIFAGDGDGNNMNPRFLKGNGDGTFQAPASLTPTPGSGSFFMDATAGDFDGDGNFDAIVGGNGGNVGFYWGNGDGTFVQETRSFPSAGRGTDAGDFNEDGDLDFVRATWSNGFVRLYLGGGDRSFAEAPAIAGDAGGDPYGVAAGDFDCDGHLDVLANDGGGGAFTLFRGNGDGSFQAGLARPELDINNHGAADAFDFDRDGILDFILSAWTSRRVYFWRGNGDGTFGSRTDLPNQPASASLGLSAPPRPRRLDLALSPAEPTVSLGDSLTLSLGGAGALATDDFQWKLGDGTMASGQSVTHTYGAEGVFVASVVHTNAEGIRTCRRTFVTVQGEAPIARPGGPYSLGESAASETRWTATLDGSASSDDFGIVRHDWDFGDGTNGTGAVVTHTWSGPGPWTLTLTVTDTAGLTGSASTTVTFTPGDPPVAAIVGPSVVDETAASSGSWSASFRAEGSSDDVRVWKYEWNFGNGRTASGFNVSTTYTSTGTYTVTLTVYDHAGQTGQATHQVSVLANDPPVAVIDGPALLDERVATGGRWASSWDASGSSDDTGIYDYRWDFGDGGSAAGSQVTHDFTAIGVYTVTLAVTDNGNQVRSTTHAVEVAANDPPVARIDASVTLVEGAQEIHLSGAPSSDDFGIHRYTWRLPPRSFGFHGSTIDHEEWRVGGNADQDGGRLLVAGTGGWGRSFFFSIATRVPRGVTFEARVDTDSNSPTHAMVGLKNLDTSSGQYTQLVYAIYFNNARLDIYERGSFRTVAGSYTRGASYDARIVTKSGAGATYFLRPSGSGQEFQEIYDSSAYNDAELAFGADVHSGVFGFDDLRVDRAVASGRDITARAPEGGEVVLEVFDHALQSHTASVDISAATGLPPSAVIAGPTEGAVGIELRFDAFASSDDHGIADWVWDFGDGSGTSGSREVAHFWSTPGTYTVTLTIFDHAGQMAADTHDIAITGESLVVAVPWRIVGGVEIPHETWSGKEVTLKAVAAHAMLPVEYTWDFGDGSPPVSGTASTQQQAYGIQARHIYTGSEGTPFTATVTITDADGNTASDTYPVLIRAQTLETEVNVAIDEGLWFIHKTQTRTMIDATTRGGFWSRDGHQSGPTSSCVQAFEINGHFEWGDATRDPYVETVGRGLNHLFTRLRPVNIGPQPYGDPDSNRNGIGLEVNDGQPIYQLGQVMDAIIAGGRQDILAAAGGVNVKGRPYGDIVQDMIDMYGWGQYDHATVGGGWRYSWGQAPDNSACQWAAIGMIPAEEVWGLSVPRWVKDRNLVWLQFSQHGSGFYGYTSSGSCVEGCNATTPSGMVQLAWDGIPSDDARWRAAEDWIADRWSNWTSQTTMYHFFAFAKAMRLAKPAPLTALQKTGKDWYHDPVNGVARILVNRQRASDGSWIGRRWLGHDNYRPYASAWAVLILSSSLFQQAPVAVIHARPNPGAVGQEITFDAGASFHQDPAFDIVEYRWDFDSSDGIDFTAPDAVGPLVTHAFGELRTYSVTLQVKDNNTPPQFDTATVEVHVTIPPHPPTADAGGPYVAAVGEDVLLDGSGSFDIDETDGDSIQLWQWEVDFVQPLDFDDGVSGETATFTGGFPTTGVKNVGLRVTDRTATVFPQAGQPDLTDDDFTQVIVYNKLVDDLAARPKDRKIQLSWTFRGDPESPWLVEVYRSETGPNYGFVRIGVTQNTYAVYIDRDVELDRRYYYRLLVFEDGANLATANPLGSSCTVAVTSSRRSRDRNRSPRITSDPVLEAIAGTEYVYDVEATDPEGQTITFFLAAGPAGMTIDSATGIVRFTPALAQLGPHDVFIEAHDPSGGAAVQIYELIVFPEANQDPVAEANGPYAGVRGEPIAFSSTGSFDPDGDALTASWNFGDGTTSNEANPVHTYTAAGHFVATLIVRDGRGGVSSDTAAVVIEEPNRPPEALIADGPEFSTRVGRELFLDASPSFDLDGDALDYEWHWGDSTPATSGVISSHVYADEGDFMGCLTVRDGRGGVDTYEFLVRVGPPNELPIAAFEITELGVNPGDQFTFDGSVSRDPDGDPISLSWDFGDGSTTSGIAVTHVWQAPGDFTVTLTVRDALGDESTATALVHINAPPVFETSPVTAVDEDTLFTYTPGVTDADGDPIMLAVAQAPAGMAFDGSTLSWTPANDDVGEHTVRILADDGNAATTEQAFTLRVTDVNDPPVITSSPPLVATEEVEYLYQVTAADVDDTVLAFSLLAAPVGMTIDGAGLVRWTPGNADVGTHGVRLRVSDPRGGEAVQEYSLAVEDVNDPPVITSAPPPAAREGETYTYDLDAVDEDDPVVTFALVVAPPGMTIDGASGVITWTPDMGGATVGVRAEARDPRGGATPQQWNIAVENVNDAPVITSSPRLQAVALREYAYQVAAEDEDGDAITFSLPLAPAGMAIDAGTGLITWTPQDTDAGQHGVTVRASDPSGDAGEQSYTLEVLERNRPPEITSTPVTLALEDEVYIYDIEATDPDGNPLVFALSRSPAGMTIDPTTGRIEWNPAAADIGDHAVEARVDDGLDEFDLQSWTLSVVAVNDAPEITSDPVREAEPGFLYAYQVEATDEEGDALSFALDAAPSGMTIGASGLIEWRPAAGQVGDHTVIVRVTDAPGASTTQEYSVAVADREHPPVVTQIADQVVQDGSAFAPILLDEYVSDPDHADSEITWSFSGNTQLAVDIDSERVARITYPAGARVSEEITFTAADPDGLSDSTMAVFTVAEPSDDDIPPVARLDAPSVLPVGVSGTIGVEATDNEGIATVTLRADGMPLALSDLGGGSWEAEFRSDATGVHRIQLTVLDIAGNRFDDAADILIVDPSLTGSLSADIISPADDSTVTGSTGVVGTVGGDHFAGYRLEYASNGTTDFIEFASGDAPVTNGMLGTLDPTLIENGVYTVRLTAFDLAGQQLSDSIVVNIEGEAKVGLFSVSFQDRILPVGQFSLAVVRTYDNRDRTRGDFGHGWKLKLNGAKLEENRIPGRDWEQTVSGGFFPRYSLAPTKAHTVTISFGEGERQEFSARPNPSSQVLFPIQFLNSMDYMATGTSRGTLVPHQQPDFVSSTSGPVEILDFEFNVYHPSGFTYTDPAGYRFVFTAARAGSLRHELRSITEPNGGMLTLGSNGYTHSSGKAVGFTRDALGRITRLEDPEGNVISYEYDLRGDLAAVVDEGGNRTTFIYDRRHNLLEIRDPLGNRAVRAEYDESGRLVATIDAEGNRTEFSHDLDGQREVVQDRLGNVTVYEYDAQGNVTRTVDPLGNETSYTYDARGNQLTETDPLGRVYSRSYDASGNVTSLTDFEGNTATYSYNSAGKLLSQTDAIGRVITSMYNAKGNELQTTDGAGAVTSSTYDADGNIASVTDAAGNVTAFTYDRSGNLTSRTDPLGNVMLATYDANNNPTSITRTQTLPDGSTEEVETRFDFNGGESVEGIVDPLGNVLVIENDPLSRPVSVTEKNGSRYGFRYSATGKIEAIEYPDGTVETVTYDAEGNETSRTNRDGETTAYEYDPLGRRTRTVYPDSTSTRVAYDAVGRVLARTDERGNVTSYSYAAGSVTETDALGSSIVREYDGDGPPVRTRSNGNLVRITNALGNETSFSYDLGTTPVNRHGLGRLTAITLADGGECRYAYDAAGNRTSFTDPAGNATSFAYDPLRNLTGVTNALGDVTAFAYDEERNRIGQTDAEGRATRFEYDALGRLTRRVLPLGQSESFTYDPNGNMLTHVDFNGATTHFAYDENNRLVEIAYPDGGVDEFAYTAEGDIVQAGQEMRVYDARGRLVEEVKADGTALSYTYDAAGNRTSVTTPAGTTSYVYDAANRLVSVTDPAGDVTTYSYDPAGNLTGTVQPNGTVFTYEYDEVNRLTSLRVTDAGGTEVAFYLYARGAAGHITRVTEEHTGRVVDYAYDVTYRLVSEAIDDPAAGARTISYTYDAAGNRLSMTDSVAGVTTYTYDANDRLLTEDGPSGMTDYTYDANGNLVRKVGPGLDVEYSYDSENRLASVDDGTDVIAYAYDADGIRTRKVVNGAEVTNYITDKNREHAQVLLETDAGGTITASYVHGLDLISVARAGAGKSFYAHDGLRSARFLSDAASNITDRYTYDAWGNVLASTGTTPNAYLYSGEQFDPEIGLYYLRARYYDPGAGRFTSMDRFGGVDEDPRTLHSYLYASGDPVNNQDPTGDFTIGSVMVSVVIAGILTTLAYDALNLFGGAGNVQGFGRRFITQIALRFARAAAIFQHAGGFVVNYQRWFGTPSFGRFLHVQVGWTKIMIASFRPIIFAQDDSHPTWFAYVYPGGELEIFLCALFWKAPLAGGFDTKYGTILHELSHEVHGTGDHAYGYTNLINLALTNPAQAVQNADSYEYNVEDNF